MRAAYDKYRDQGFEVLSISVGEGDAEVAEFIEKYDLDYRFLLDRTGATSESYRVSSTPTTYFVAPDGTITDSLAGVVSVGWIEKNLDPYIST